jgi:ABC-2 type transporter
MAAGLAASIVIDDRKEGFWNRSILAGVRTSEILVAHSIVCMFIMSLQMTSVVLACTFVKMRFEGSVFLLMAFLMLYGWGGVFFGLLAVNFFSSHMLVQAFFLCASNVTQFLSGNISINDENLAVKL